MADRDKRRVFFALWPDTRTAAAVDAIADRLVRGGRRISRTQLHMTLAFVGTVGQQTVRNLMACASDIAVPAFSLSLDQVGYFRRPQIPWLGVSHIPAQLQLLADAVVLAANPDAGRYRLRPHVSLARSAPPPAAGRGIKPVAWAVRSFCLAESGVNGTPGRYRCLQRWQLQ